jgi:hypothetical protein
MGARFARQGSALLVCAGFCCTLTCGDECLGRLGFGGGSLLQARVRSAAFDRPTSRYIQLTQSVRSLARRIAGWRAKAGEERGSNVCSDAQVCPVRAKCRSLRGAFWGAKCSLWGLVWARLRQRELAFCLLRASAALTGTVWWSMVRRRSTVRFRKGAPQVRRVFRLPIRGPLPMQGEGPEFNS